MRKSTLLYVAVLGLAACSDDDRGGGERDASDDGAAQFDGSICTVSSASSSGCQTTLDAAQVRLDASPDGTSTANDAGPDASCVRGRVTFGGVPVSEAIVSALGLTQGDAWQVRTDSSGSFLLDLPVRTRVALSITDASRRAHPLFVDLSAAAELCRELGDVALREDEAAGPCPADDSCGGCDLRCFEPALPGAPSACVNQRCSCAGEEASCETADYARFATYHLGNSLTADSTPLGVAAMARQVGLAGHTIGGHLKCGSPLPQIVQQPDVTCAIYGETGPWTQALHGFRWDVMTVQPYPTSTLEDDVNTIRQLVGEAQKNPANASLKLLVLAAWPSNLGEQNFSEVWQSDTGGNDATTMTRDHMLDVLNGVRAGTSDAEKNALIIPTGDVLSRLDVLMRAGEVPGYRSAKQLYRDDAHLNNIGRFVASTTMLAVLYKRDPRGILAPAEYFRIFDPATDRELGDALRAQLQAVIWEVVSTHPYAGIYPGQ